MRRAHWLRILTGVGCACVMATAALANGHSLRFFGTASGVVDRVQIRYMLLPIALIVVVDHIPIIGKCLAKKPFSVLVIHLF